MKAYTKNISLLFLTLFVLVSCSKDDDGEGKETNLSDMDALVAIDKANPTNVLGWDIEEEDLSKWNHVTLTDGRVTSLMLEDMGLEKLPDEIRALTELDTLNLASNGITELPESIGDLKDNLKYLGLFENKLEGYPEVISGLTNLRNLHLGRNTITELSPSIEKLVNLEELQLISTGLTSLPKEIGGLVSLKKLNVYSNQRTLKNLPIELVDLENLERIDISSCDNDIIPKVLLDRAGDDDDFSIVYWRGNSCD